MKAILTIAILLLAVVMIGCVGQSTTPQKTNESAVSPSEGGQQGTPGEEVSNETAEGTEETGGAAGAGTDWCVPGTQWNWVGGQAGETGSLSFEIKGIETYEGQQMCHAVGIHEQGGQKMKWDYYFDKDEEKVCYKMTDLTTGTELGHGCVKGG